MNLNVSMPTPLQTMLLTFTFSHLADAFIQSDLHMCDLQCIHILHFTLMAHCTPGAIRGSVSCPRTLRQGIELATFCLLNDFFTSCTTVAPGEIGRAHV